MGDTAQTCFDGTDNDRGIRISLAGALAINDNGTIRSLVRFTIRRIGVVRAYLAIRGIAVDHGIHVARRDAIKEFGFAQFPEVFGGMPVRLADDAYTKPLGLQQSTNQ